MNKMIDNFWQGKLPLWKSYWIVGELINALMIILLINLDIYFFGNITIGNQIPFVNFNNFNFLIKIILICWTLFITVGIWRAAENYKGNIIWIVLTLIFLSYRIFTLRIIF